MTNTNKFIIIMLMIVSLSFNVFALGECPTVLDLNNKTNYIAWDNTIYGVEITEQNLKPFNGRLIIDISNKTESDLVSYQYAPLCNDSRKVTYTDYFNTSSPFFNREDLTPCYLDSDCNAQDDYLIIKESQRLRMFKINESLGSFFMVGIFYLVFTFFPFIKGNKTTVLMSTVALFIIGMILIASTLPLIMGVLVLIQAFIYLIQIKDPSLN